MQLSLCAHTTQLFIIAHTCRSMRRTETNGFPMHFYAKTASKLPFYVSLNDLLDTDNNFRFNKFMNCVIRHLSLSFSTNSLNQNEENHCPLVMLELTLMPNPSIFNIDSIVKRVVNTMLTFLITFSKPSDWPCDWNTHNEAEYY